MESINPTQAQRVWQRVKGPESQEDLFARLLALEAECRQIIGYLQKHTHLRDSRGLSRLREDCGQFFHMLRGLSLIGGLDVTVTAPPSVRGNPEGLLRQYWVTRQKIIVLLEGLEEPCNRLLKQTMEEHSLLVLNLLGQLPR